jgi:protocatechuate 3,4-dioxygenase beta subunit
VAPTPTFAPTATTAAGSRPVQAGGGSEGCLPTADDGPGPNYESGAPERDSVGSGYILSGSVIESTSCRPVPGALVEFWMAGPDGEYGPDWRASLLTDGDGKFAFESHVPVSYGGDPHIHIRLSGADHSELFLVHVPEPGASSGQVAAVLRPK